MPSMTDRQSVALNATVQNVYADDLHYRLKYAAKVIFLATAAAVGLFVTFIIGDQTFVDDQEVSAQNRMPLFPDDIVAEAAGIPGDEIIVRYRNTTGAAIVAFSRVDIVPL